MLMYISNLQEGNLVCDISITLINHRHFLYLEPQLTSSTTNELWKYYTLSIHRPLFTMEKSEKL